MEAEMLNCKKRSKFEPQKVFSELEFVFFQTTYRVESGGLSGGCRVSGPLENTSIDRKTIHKQETQQTKHNET